MGEVGEKRRRGEVLWCTYWPQRFSEPAQCVLFSSRISSVSLFVCAVRSAEWIVPTFSLWWVHKISSQMIAAIAADTFPCVAKTSEGFWVIYRHVADMAIIITAKRFEKARDSYKNAYCYCHKSTIMWVSHVSLIKTVSYYILSGETFWSRWLTLKAYRHFQISDYIQNWIWRQDIQLWIWKGAHITMVTVVISSALVWYSAAVLR